MKALKKLLEKIKRPNIFVAAVTGIFLIGFVILTALVLTTDFLPKNLGFFSYIFYFFSALFLGYFIYCIVYLAPRAKNSVVEWADKRDFTRKIVGQYGFRTIAFATVSCIVSLANAAVNGITGIITGSMWFLSLGVYYLLLSAMRGLALFTHSGGRKIKREDKNGAETELKAYIILGIGLIILPVALSAVIWEIVGSDKGFVKSGYMIYFSAAYTFYKVISSVVNTVKARKEDAMTVRAVRNINLADAGASLLALQTSMFKAFSPDMNLGYANAVMGAIVCALTIAIGVFMTVNGGKKLKAVRMNKSEEEGNG